MKITKMKFSHSTIFNGFLMKTTAIVFLPVTVALMPYAWLKIGAMSHVSGRPQHRSGSVGMIFSAHETDRDGDWVVEKMRVLMSRIDRRGPVVIWLEHAQPAGLPENIDAFQKQFGGMQGEINWYREVMQETMPSESPSLFREIFEERQANDPHPVENFFNTSDPFFREIRDEIQKLRRAGWKIEIRTERPSWEAYRDYLRQNVMCAVALQWLSRGDKIKALGSLAASYRFFAQAIQERDRTLGSQIADVERLHPGSFHIVLRGLAHERSLSDEFRKRGIRTRRILQSPARGRAGSLGRGLQRYLLTFGEFPTLDTPLGRRFLIQQLSRISEELKPALPESLS